MSELDRHLDGPEAQRFRDFRDLARLMAESGDLEPWADLIKGLHTDGMADEPTLWLIYLYNEYDIINSAWRVFARWDDPYAWHIDPDREMVTKIPHMMERRNLHGGRGLIRCNDYLKHLGGKSQAEWLRRGLGNVGNGAHGDNFLSMTRHLRQIWGVGRQAAFEWAEFLGKVMCWPVSAPHGQLWESSGPRESLTLLYSNPTPTMGQLESYAEHLRAWLTSEGVPLTWEDFETVICDFKVMRKGRYYPGKHLSEIKEEILEVEDEKDRERLMGVFHRMVPQPWGGIDPGVKEGLLARYRDEGRIFTPVPVPGFALHEGA